MFRHFFFTLSNRKKIMGWVRHVARVVLISIREFLRQGGFQTDSFEKVVTI